MNQKIICRLRTGIFTAALFFAGFVKAQTSQDVGLFHTTDISHEFNDKWSVYVENQWRSLDGFQKFYYYELKGGVTYALNDNFSLTLGTGIYETFREGPEFENYSKQFENRIWEQLDMSQELSIIDFSHRYRIEQRFKGGYENRFRYRLKAEVPINSREIEVNTFYAVAYDELFFTDQAPNFSRNRFHLGAGYQLSESVGVNAGWLRQVDFSENSTRKKSYIFTAL